MDICDLLVEAGASLEEPSFIGRWVGGWAVTHQHMRSLRGPDLAAPPGPLTTVAAAAAAGRRWRWQRMLEKRRRCESSSL